MLDRVRGWLKRKTAPRRPPEAFSIVREPIERGGIVDGSVLSVELFGRALDPRAYLLALYPEANIPEMDVYDQWAPSMRAYVNHGIWNASCECGAPGLPSPGMVVFLAYPYGWCVRCDNAACGGAWRPMAIPSIGMREAIEAVLVMRPNADDRNWEPGETVVDLIEQNAEHGDPTVRGL